MRKRKRIEIETESELTYAEIENKRILQRRKKRKKPVKVKGCPHLEIESRRSYRKNYPFGTKSKPRQGSLKKIIRRCKHCGKIINERKIR